MTEQNFSNKPRTSDRSLDNLENLNNLENLDALDNSDQLADRDQVDADDIVEAPMGGTLPAVSPLNAPAVKEFSGFNSALHSVPSGDAVVEERPLDSAPLVAAPLTEPNVIPAASMDTQSKDTRGNGALLTYEVCEQLRGRWNEIQGKFVDEPRTAVQQADVLVSEVIGNITEMITQEHSTLESQWNRGNDVSTEDLRKALQRYRTFFNRLVLPRAD